MTGMLGVVKSTIGWDVAITRRTNGRIVTTGVVTATEATGVVTATEATGVSSADMCIFDSGFCSSTTIEVVTPEERTDGGGTIDVLGISIGVFDNVGLACRMDCIGGVGGGPVIEVEISETLGLALGCEITAASSMSGVLEVTNVGADVDVNEEENDDDDTEDRDADDDAEGEDAVESARDDSDVRLSELSRIRSCSCNLNTVLFIFSD
jgi:PKD repeat protein